MAGTSMLSLHGLQGTSSASNAAQCSADEHPHTLLYEHTGVCVRARTRVCVWLCVCVCVCVCMILYRRTRTLFFQFIFELVLVT